MKKLSILAINTLIATVLFLTACPPCPYTYTGVTLEISSAIGVLPASLQIPSVSLMDSGDIALDSVLQDDSTYTWSNDALSAYAGRILTFSITLQDPAGHQRNIPLDTIQIKENSIINYYISIGYNSHPGLRSMTHKFHPVGDITGNAADSVVTVYNYWSTECY